MKNAILALEKRHKAFEDAAKPLIQFINEHGNPHMIVVVENDRAESFSGEQVFNTTEFIKD